MNKKLILTFKIIGIVLIVLGITLTIIPLFHFDGDTFKLMPAMLSGIVLPLVGIIMIVVASIIGTKNADNSSISDIAKKMKDTISDSTTTISKSATKTCKYCGCKCEKDCTNCPNCGAEIK